MIEVQTTDVGNGKLEWDCPHCGSRMRSGKLGIESRCDHLVRLKVKRFDCVIACFQDKSQSGQ